MKLWPRRIGHKGQPVWLPSILIRFLRDLWNIREPSFEALVRSLLMFYDHHHEHRGTAGAARQPLNPGLDGLQFTIVHSIGFMTNTKYQGRNWCMIQDFNLSIHLTSPSLLFSKHQTLNDVYLLGILHANLAFRYLHQCLLIVDCVKQLLEWE